MKFLKKIMIISNNFINILLYNFEISKFTKLKIALIKQCKKRTIIKYDSSFLIHNKLIMIKL